jgi:hypothetical protein
VGRVVERDVVEERRVEVRAELSVEDEQYVAVELGRDPRAVVVGGLEDARVLDEVRSEQQEPVVVEPLGKRAQEAPPAARGKLPIVPPRKATMRGRPGRAGGISSRWRSKSPAMPWTSRPGYSAVSASATSRTSCSSTSNGT